MNSRFSSMQQNQLIGQQYNFGDMQQQQRRLLGQHNNDQNLQQQQQHQQQQHLLGTQPDNSSMQTNQHSVCMLQQPKVPWLQETAINLLPTQGQQSQSQLPQQQLMSQIQSLPTQFQQQLVLQEQSNPLQQDLQPRLQASSQAPASLLQQQIVIDQQKQLYQSQRPLPETSSTSLDLTAQTIHANGGDWQEEVYQKIKDMKEMYLPELNVIYQKLATKLQQHDSLQQQRKSVDLEKIKMFKTLLERIIAFLQVSKHDISPRFKEKLGSYEKQIINFVNVNRPKEMQINPRRDKLVRECE
ncbi:mediator of RNA polymerase II transcription subunit 15a isoform X2 [Hevea brasiliensis]|nr:mediator of RNA polymerase II transcription subunit 15a isoform X2 [Hevea brasiliensis]